MLAVAIWVSWSSLAAAKIYELSPSDDWFGVLSNNRLEPGDEVILAGGVYSDRRKLKMWQQGTVDKPIIIRSKDGERAVITRPDARQNVINIEGGQNLILRGLEVTGGSAGIRLGGGLNGQPNFGDSSRFVTIEDSLIHGVGDAAISANNNGERYEGMIFRRNEIFDTGGVGEAFYLGCNNNRCQFFDGLIEGNYIHDLEGPRVSQGDGIEIKDGSYNNIVRDNVIHNTGFPGILAYGTAGNGGPNIIERNVIWSSNNQGIQVAADAIVRNNIVFSNGAESFRSQNHQGARPGNLVIVNNTFVSDRSVAIRIADEATASIVIANNAVYARSGTSIKLASTNQVTVSGNVGFGRTVPMLGVDAFQRTGDLETDFVDVDWRGPQRDAFPADGSALIGAGDPDYVPRDDFNGTPRNGKLDVGAYVFSRQGNPGWSINNGFKTTRVPGDFNNNRVLDAMDIDLLSAAVLVGSNELEFDLNADATVDQEDRDVWVRELANTWYGDADLDGQFSSSDLVIIFQAGKYERSGDDAGAAWVEGDWNGDGRFGTADLTLAFQSGGYEQGPRGTVMAVVPEPRSRTLLAIALLGFGASYRTISYRYQLVPRER